MTRIYRQCAIECEIGTFSFDGSTLTRMQPATLKFTARPGSLATGWSR